MTKTIEDLQDEVKFYQNQSKYYQEKYHDLKNKISDYETERKDLTGRLEKIFELTKSDQADANTLDQIYELTKY